MNFVLQ